MQRTKALRVDGKGTGLPAGRYALLFFDVVLQSAEDKLGDALLHLGS
jgi:hypothetical protein